MPTNKAISVHFVILSIYCQFVSVLGATEPPTTKSKAMFLVQPKPEYYVVRNEPVTLECEAFRVVKLMLQCNEEYVERSRFILTSNESRNSQTIKMNFTKTDIDQQKEADTDSLTCLCIAWPIDTENIINKFYSEKSTISLAFLKKSFKREPLKVDAEYGRQAEFLCTPPEGKPEPKVIWTKNKKAIDENSLNYQISNGGRTLLIHQVSFEDQGEYMCAAANLAGERFSTAAPLRVIVKGNWTPWSEWSECTSTCGRGIQSRTRECHYNNAAEEVLKQLDEDGTQICQGESKQTADCTKMCPQDGGWSEWGSWHACGINCVKYRRRQCNNPSPSHGGMPCLGDGFDRANCTGGECNLFLPGEDGGDLSNPDRNNNPYYDNNNNNNRPTIREHPSHISIKEIFLYAGLATLLAMFLGAIAIFVCLLHRRNKFYSGVISIHERHQHYPPSTYTTEIPLSKSSKGNGSITNMFEMPYHISHNHLSYLTHQSRGAHSTTGTPGCPMGGGSAILSPGNPKHNTISGAHRMSSNPGNNNSATACPASYMSSDGLSAHSMPNPHGGNLTPTYHYIEEALCAPQISPGSLTDPQSNSLTHMTSDIFAGPVMAPSSGNCGEVPVYPPPLYSSSDPQYAHISECEMSQQRHPQCNSSQQPRCNKRMSGHSNSRFSIDSGHCGDQASHNSSETDDQLQQLHHQTSPPSGGSGTGTMGNGHQGAYRLMPSPLTCLGMLPSSIDDGHLAAGRVECYGGRISIPDLRISLLIPEGAIAPGKTEEIFLAVSSEISENPRLINTRDSILSATVFAGPPSVKFLKPVILSFDQSALRTEIDWTCSVYTQAPNADWKICSERENTVHFNNKSCYLLSDTLKFKYCLVGKATSSAVKCFQTVVFGGFLSQGNNYSVRVYILNDNRDALVRTKGEEMKMGGFLLNKPIKIPLKFDAGSIKVSLGDICPDWAEKCGTEQEIPLERVWNDTSGNFHLSFNFQAKDPASLQPLNADVILQQMETHSVSVAIGPKEIPACPIAPPNNCMYNSDHVFKLSPFIRDRIVAVLGDSWAKLAKAIKVEKPVIDYLKKCSSPMDSVLDIWECRILNEHVDLISIFRRLNKPELAEMLECDPVYTSHVSLYSSSALNSCHLSSSC